MMKPSHFLNAELMRMRTFEKRTLCADNKNELVAAMRLHLAKLLNQLNGVAPTQIAGQFAPKEAFV